MTIIHVLRDGTRVKDLTDHVVKDLPDFYNMISDIDRRLNNGKKKD